MDARLRPFDHERLEVYGVSLEVIDRVHRIREHMPVRGVVLDELERASMSIVLNLAEGCGEYSKREKARFFRMALRSATEAAAVLDVGSRRGLWSPVDAEAGKELLRRIVAMLTALARRHEHG